MIIEMPKTRSNPISRNAPNNAYLTDGLTPKYGNAVKRRTKIMSIGIQRYFGVDMPI
ncbi:MAG TPA: hypothetical protein HA269_02990 [Ferroplasma sp.]|nr:hypothetical protein [Ferroplasma sp.]